ncbi:MAG: hypothetical protein KHW50_07395 [Clostridium sp.]|nr:hypothetical protein [Clostridium sp.]
MKENSREKDEEILNNIKSYMQENIDKGYHKFVYNDLGYDEKCVNVINAIEHILSDYKRVLKENEELKVIKSAIQTLQTNSLEEEKYIVISKSSFLVGSYKHLLDDYIPIQKIKDKIEELSKTKGDLATHIAVSERIRALQEILEESEE